MYKVQDYCVLNYNAVYPVKCKGWHFTDMWKHLHGRSILLI